MSRAVLCPGGDSDNGEALAAALIAPKSHTGGMGFFPPLCQGERISFALWVQDLEVL